MRRFMNSDGNLECLKTVMPRGLRIAFITMLHEGLTGGHLGRRRTGRLVSDAFQTVSSWRAMGSDFA
jgi:hypothetical protein